MKIEELMTKECVAVKPTSDLNDAAHQMWTHDCGALPVVDDDQRVVGMLTDRDICMCAYHQGKGLKDLAVEDAMSRKVVTCSLEDEATAAQEIMRHAQIRRLPVTDSEGHLKGILTLAQIARAGGDGKAKGISKAQVGETLAAISRPLEAPRAV